MGQYSIDNFSYEEIEKNPVEGMDYEELFNKLKKENPPITLGSQYAYFVKDNMLRFLIRMARYKFVTKMINDKDNVLEIGCGSGLGAMYIAQNCSRVLGIDINEEEINEAKETNRRDNIEFKNIDFFNMIENEKYDVIVSLDVIEHMNEEDGKKFLDKTRKHLKKDGILILGTPSIYSYKYQGALSKADHIKCYDKDELVNVIENYFNRTLAFSMNDEIVHTGHPKMAWYYFIIAFSPK